MKRCISQTVMVLVVVAWILGAAHCPSHNILATISYISTGLALWAAIHFSQQVKFYEVKE